MDKGLQWLEAIITVVFDLEEGQLPDKIIPPDYGSEKDRKTISYNSFPDSFTFNLEGQTVYSFYLRKENKDDPQELVHCYACFSQKKDPKNPRGYFQKSVVFLTKIKLYNFFKKLFEDVARTYFESGEDNLLREAFEIINEKWAQPENLQPGIALEIFGKKYETKIEKDVSYKNRLTPEPYLSELIKDGGELSGLLAEKKQEIKEKSDPPRLGICDDFNQINLFTIMGKQRICLILKLWEIMMLNECLLILADTPVICR